MPPRSKTTSSPNDQKKTTRTTTQKFVIHNQVSYCNSLPKRECNASEAQQNLKQEVKKRLASDANFENLLFSGISGKDVDQQQISNLLKWLENEKSNNNFVTLVEKALNKTEGERVQDARKTRTSQKSTASRKPPVKKAANQRKDIIKQANDQSRIKPFQKALEELDSFAVLNCNIEKWKKLASSEQLFNILEKCSETLLCELRENSRDSQGQNNSSKEDEMSANQSKSSKELQISHNLWY